MTQQQKVDAAFAEIGRELAEIIDGSRGDSFALRSRLVYDGHDEHYLKELIKRSTSLSGRPAVVVFAIPMPIESHRIPRDGDLFVGFVALDKESDTCSFDLDVAGEVVAHHNAMSPGEVRIAFHEHQQVLPLISMYNHIVNVVCSDKHQKSMPWLLYASLDIEERRILAMNQWKTDDEQIAYGYGYLMHASSLSKERPTLILPRIILHTGLTSKSQPSVHPQTPLTITPMTIIDRFFDKATTIQFLKVIKEHGWHKGHVRHSNMPLELLSTMKVALSSSGLKDNGWSLAGDLAGFGDSALGPHHEHRDGALQGGNATLIVFLHSEHGARVEIGGDPTTVVVVPALMGRAVLFDVDVLHRSIKGESDAVAPIVVVELRKDHEILECFQCKLGTL